MALLKTRLINISKLLDVDQPSHKPYHELSMTKAPKSQVIDSDEMFYLIRVDINFLALGKASRGICEQGGVKTDC